MEDRAQLSQDAYFAMFSYKTNVMAITKLSSIEINYINLIFHIKIFKIQFNRSRDTINTRILEKENNSALVELHTTKMYDCYF